MGKRLFLAASLMSLLTSAGCLRGVCERHGYYPVATQAQAPACCVPCCPPCAPASTGYAAPPPAWNQPAAAPCTCAPVPHP
jgi:hypothetical protein